MKISNLNISSTCQFCINKINSSAHSVFQASLALVNRVIQAVVEIFRRIAFFFKAIPADQKIAFHNIQRQELIDNMLPACITSATCKQDDASWTTPLGAASVDLSPYLAHLPQGFIYLADNNTIVHKQTAMVIKVYETDTKRFICFGAKSAILYSGLDNVTSSSKYVTAQGILGAFGACPAFFEKTLAITDFFTNHTPFFNDDKQTAFTGHSYGASLAQIAAIHSRKQAICFAPFHLGAGIQYKLGADKLAACMNRIKIIYVENDWLKSPVANSIVKTISFFRLRHPNNFGRHSVMPSAYPGSAPSHAFLMGSYMTNLGYAHRTKACDLDPAVLAQFK